MTFLEAPESVEQMEQYCRIVDGPKLANMLEQGSTPILPPQELKSLGYTMAAYPLTLLSASIQAMNLSLERIKKGEATDDLICKCKFMLCLSFLQLMFVDFHLTIPSRGDQRLCWVYEVC